MFVCLFVLIWLRCRMKTWKCWINGSLLPPGQKSSDVGLGRCSSHPWIAIAAAATHGVQQGVLTWGNCYLGLGLMTAVQSLQIPNPQHSGTACPLPEDANLCGWDQAMDQAGADVGSSLQLPWETYLWLLMPAQMHWDGRKDKKPQQQQLLLSVQGHFLLWGQLPPRGPCASCDTSTTVLLWCGHHVPWRVGRGWHLPLLLDEYCLYPAQAEFTLKVQANKCQCLSTKEHSGALSTCL